MANINKIKENRTMKTISSKKQTELLNRGYSIKVFNDNENSEQWAMEKQNSGYDVIIGKSSTSIKGLYRSIGFYKVNFDIEEATEILLNGIYSA